MRQEMLREQLASAKSKGEETVGRNLQMQLERLLARQMEILQDAAVQERLQALDWRIPPAALKYLSDAHVTNGNAAADNGRESQDDRPINLRVVSQNMQEGDIPLGKQLANELKRHHNNHNNHNNHHNHHNHNAEDTTAAAAAAENGTLQQVLSHTDKKTIKSEPEDST
ncbi:hypothetical protein CRUP_007303 [Coryphaenoides rupestris]|nr:hypothetical protein CRUP_007303 [Coryphaenoides rupestris]